MASDEMHIPRCHIESASLNLRVIAASKPSYAEATEGIALDSKAVVPKGGLEPEHIDAAKSRNLRGLS